MLKENEIREREHIAVLELLQIAIKLNEAHSKLVMRRFLEAKGLLLDVLERTSSLLKIIPFDKGD